MGATSNVVPDRLSILSRLQKSHPYNQLPTIDQPVVQIDPTSNNTFLFDYLAYYWFSLVQYFARLRLDPVHSIYVNGLGPRRAK